MTQSIEFKYLSSGIMEITIDGYSRRVDVKGNTPQVKYDKIRQLILDAGWVFTEKIEHSLKKELGMDS